MASKIKRADGLRSQRSFFPPLALTSPFSLTYKIHYRKAQVLIKVNISFHWFLSWDAEAYEIINLEEFYSLTTVYC